MKHLSLIAAACWIALVPARAAEVVVTYKTHQVSLSDIEDILGRPLPRSAYRFTSWWGNGAINGLNTRRLRIDSSWCFWREPR